MGAYLLSALLLVAPLFCSAPVLPTFLQSPRSQQGYGDSPRAVPFQGVHLSMGAAERRLTKMVEPEYPHTAEAQEVEGNVVFRIIIGTDGRVKELHLRRGKPLFIESAAKAISKWQYETFRLNGNAVEVETFATVQFRLPGKH